MNAFRYVVVSAILALSGCASTSSNGFLAAEDRWIQEQLDSIIIERLDYIDAPMRQVIQDLATKTALADPGGIGITFGVSPPDPVERTVVKELHVSHITLRNAIKFISMVTGLKYRIENGVVVFLPIEGPLETRAFRVPPGPLGLKRNAPRHLINEYVRKVFRDNWYLDLAPPCRIAYNIETEILVITAYRTDVQSLTEILSMRLDKKTTIQSGPRD